MELLVVVLIIGILASVVVPQYEVAVGKTRYTEMRVWGERIKRAVELDFLANGRATSQSADFSSCRPLQDLDLEIPGGAEFKNNNSISITSKITASRYSYSNCGILLTSYIPEQIQYIQVYNPTVKDGVWEQAECRAYGPIGRKVCKSLGAKPKAGSNIVFVFE